MDIVLYFFKALHVFRMSGLLREDSWILITASTFNLVQWVVLFMKTVHLIVGSFLHQS